MTTQKDKIENLFHIHYHNSSHEIGGVFHNKWREISGWNKDGNYDKATKIYKKFGPGKEFNHWLLVNMLSKPQFSVFVSVYGKNLLSCQPKKIFPSFEDAKTYCSEAPAIFAENRFARLISVQIFNDNILQSPENIVYNTQISLSKYQKS